VPSHHLEKNLLIGMEQRITSSHFKQQCQPSNSY
jgi:hypothetical protein